MLNENEVVDILCEHLEGTGYTILKRCTTKEKGIDIIAKHNERPGRLLVEAKGSTSSIEGTQRHGKPFSSSQALTRIAKGFYTAACLICCERKSNDIVALAYPDIEIFRIMLEKIKPVLAELQIQVFLVRQNKEIIVFS